MGFCRYFLLVKKTRYFEIKKVKIFRESPEDEGRFKIQYAASQDRLEPRGVSPNQSTATIPWDRVTFNHISPKYLKYIN
jgi:hypothetical protein